MISLINAKRIITKCSNDVKDTVTLRIRKLLRNLSQRKIRKAWERYHLRRKCCFRMYPIMAASTVMQPIIELRAKNVIKSFIKDMFCNVNLKLKVRYFVSKVITI